MEIKEWFEQKKEFLNKLNADFYEQSENIEVLKTSIIIKDKLNHNLEYELSLSLRKISEINE